MARNEGKEGEVRKPHQRRRIGNIRCGWKPHLPGSGHSRRLGNRTYRVWGVVARLGNLACWAEVQCWVKMFEFTRVICYDVSDVERMYLFRLQCPQSDVRVAADNCRGWRALLLSGRSAGK